MNNNFDRKIILASHGGLSKGLKDSLEMIVGTANSPVEYYGLYPGENPQDIFESIKAEIDNNSEKEYIILTDLFGGSVCNALLPLSIYKNVVIIAGMNLPLLMEIVLSSNSMLDSDNLKEVLTRARTSLLKAELRLDETFELDDF